MFIARLFLQRASDSKKSAAVILGGLRKAYYSVLVELVLEPVLTEGGRQTVLDRLQCDSLRQQVLAAEIAAGHCLFGDIKLPTDLHAVVREWLRLPWFTVQGCPDFFVHNISVKPGDPSTDVIFAFAFHCFHSTLLGRSRESGLAEVVMQCGTGIDRGEVPPVEVPIGAPPFMDDLCGPLMDDCPGRLLKKVVQAAKFLTLRRLILVFASQYGAGKTEAIVAIRGK